MIFCGQEEFEEMVVASEKGSVNPSEVWITGRDGEFHVLQNSKVSRFKEIKDVIGYIEKRRNIGKQTEPCPKCSCQNVYTKEQDGQYRIYCFACEYGSEFRFTSEEEAYEDWNNRTAIPGFKLWDKKIKCFVSKSWFIKSIGIEDQCWEYIALDTYGNLKVLLEDGTWLEADTNRFEARQAKEEDYQ